jgi:CRP/FNR family cyclic AMP-dependent transcriptional regulator
MRAKALEPVTLVRSPMLTNRLPRSASCTAVNTVRCAILTRDALNQLLNDDPRTAAKLMMAISLRIAERMRESADKLKLYAQLTQAMQEEINNLMPL